MLITHFSQVTPEWLSHVLGCPVVGIEAAESTSSWASHQKIAATLEDGSTRKLWLKLCLGDTFGRSEVDYYTRDYVDLPGAPLIPCYDAHYEAGKGYHILLEDLSETYADRKVVAPTLEYALALATALARLHKHQWGKGTPRSSGDWAAYFDHIRPGVPNLEAATGLTLSANFDRHAEQLVQRWSNPIGLTLLHGDVNPTNVLTPRDADFPIYILDRQPFDWAILYGLAASDLAYAVVPWWPYDFRKEHEEAILRCWHEALDAPEYSWELAQDDWELSVEHCLHVPIEWCSKSDDVEGMRWLWGWQLGNMLGPEAPK